MRVGVLALLALLAVQDQPASIRGLRQPAVSPDGKTLAFSWHGDIWTAPLTGGRATRITESEADEQFPAWSPDGKKLAFTSDEQGNRDVFVIDLESSRSRQITFHSAEDDRPSWSPDGKSIAFESNRDPNVDLPVNDEWFDVWVCPAEGGTASRVTRYGGRNPCWSEDGRWIAYDRYATGYGDGEHDLYVVESNGGSVPRLLVSGKEDTRRATFKGSVVYYSTGQNIWKIPFEGGPSFQLTGFETGRTLNPSVSLEADLLVFENDYEFYYLSLKERAPRPRKIEIAVEGDPYEESRAKTIERTLDGGLRSPAWSPDSKCFVGSLESDLWIVPSDGGQARQLTETIDEERDPSWTADGKHIVYVSGPFGMPGDVFRISAEGGRPEKLTNESAQYRCPKISDDGKLLACILDGASSADVALIEVDSGRLTQVLGQKETDEGYPVLHEKRLAFIRYDPARDRSEIVVCEIDRKREQVVYEETGQCLYMDWSRDGEKLLYCRIDDNGYASARILSLKDKLLYRIPRDRGMSVHAPAWSPDASMVVCEERKVLRGYEEDRTSDLIVRNVARSEHSTEVRFEATRKLSRQDEMLEIMLQAWGLYARSFYDPFFHGVDWNKVRQKYSGLARHCQTRAELYDLINDMIRELRASHVHLKPPSVAAKVRTGMLGIDYEVMKNGWIRVTDLVEGGPASWSNIKKGEIIQAVGATELALDQDLDALLTRPGEEGIGLVALEVRSGSDAVRTVEVRPISMAELRKLKYENLIRRRKERVKERSKGRLAYHHIQFMNASEVKRLKEAIETEFGDAEGLALDIRDGMGGLAHWQVMSLLNNAVRQDYKDKAVLYMRYRNGRVIPDIFSFNPIGGTVPEDVSFKRPVVLVQNEVSRSDKEIFSYIFNAIGMGYRVGTPTAGGVIGGFPNRLVDGSNVVVSVQGWFTKEGTNLEGFRVPPDVYVDRSIEDWHAGRDPQLDKAIEVLLAQLEGKLPLPRKESK